MREFVIMTDSDTEIPYHFAEANDVPVFLMPYTLDGKESLFDLGKSTDFPAFYKALRAGASATTATRSPSDIQAFYETLLADHKDILYICFSSQLSSHHEFAQMARVAALERFPDARIEVIDSASIAMGAGLLVYHAVNMKREGRSFDEIFQWVMENRYRALHFFTIDSLAYLQRTGRLSAVSRTFGTVLDIKPVLMLTKEGKIIVFDKVRGRRSIVKYLADKVEQNQLMDEISQDLIVVYHADDIAQADLLKDEISRRFHFKNIWVQNVGPVIGCHCGPGTLAICMMGRERAK